MRVVLKLLIIFIGMLAVVISPIAVPRFVNGCKTLHAADAYVREKVKVDSLRGSSSLYRNGGKSSTVYQVYIHGLDRQVSIATHERNPFYKSGDGDALHFTRTMEEHHDSIWIWYHPEAELRYARSTEFPMREVRVAAVVDGAIVGLAVFALVWLVRYLIRKRALRRSRIIH